MSEVIYNNDDNLDLAPRPAYKRAYGSMTEWLIAHDFGKTTTEVNIVMLAVVSSILTITFLVSVTSFQTPKISSEHVRMIEWAKKGHWGIPPADFMPVENN